MNLRKNNGFAGIDISISLLIILIFIPTIFGMGYNIQKVDNAVKRESRAINTATDILETAKTLEFQDVKLGNEDNFAQKLYEKNYIKTNNDQISVLGNIQKSEYSYEGVNGELYKVNISFSYPNNEENDLVKIITVEVEYPIGNTTKTVEISSVLKSV